MSKIIPGAESLPHNSGCRSSILSKASTLGRGPPQQCNHDDFDGAGDDSDDDDEVGLAEEAMMRQID